MRMAKRYCRCEDYDEKDNLETFYYITHLLNSGENVINNKWENARIIGRAENSVRLARRCLAIREYCSVVALFMNALFYGQI